MKEMSPEMRFRCMECRRLEGYCQDAPYMHYGETCEHLRAIGPEMKAKLAKQRMARGE